jgi:hypothetical protein
VCASARRDEGGGANKRTPLRQNNRQRSRLITPPDQLDCERDGSAVCVKGKVDVGTFHAVFWCTRRVLEGSVQKFGVLLHWRQRT